MITAEHLSKRFGQTVAVSDLMLHVGSSEIYGLVGPDGAGKTTTMRLLCGALTPDNMGGGQPPVVTIDGQDMLRHTDAARAQIGYLPQRFSMYEELTVLENLRFFAEVRGLAASDWQARSREILEFVGLAAFGERRAGQLSGGMKQKLGLAAALVHRPRVLLLDEPTTGVDPVTRQDFWQLIIRLVGQEGVAVLVSTPYMDEAARCTRVGFMRQGKLLTEGQPQALLSRVEGRILEMRGQPLPLLRRLARQDEAVEDAQMFGDRLHLRVRVGTAQVVMKRLPETIAAQGGEVSLVLPIQPGLEDVFIALLEEGSKSVVS
jgi:ABC-2 type transport system ATP-binding protein